MGSKLWAVDVLLSGIIKPMFNAYIFGQHKTAAFMLYTLNSFLLGYGEGVDNLPIPRHLAFDMTERSMPSLDYQKWYEKYAPAILLKMGKYIRAVLDSLPNQTTMPQVDADDLVSDPNE